MVDIVYAGDHGGCLMCDSIGSELADRGHRQGCRSMYADEPPRPATWRAQQRRDEAKKLRARADKLEAEADAIIAAASPPPTPWPGSNPFKANPPDYRGRQ